MIYYILICFHCFHERYKILYILSLYVKFVYGRDHVIIFIILLLVNLFVDRTYYRNADQYFKPIRRKSFYEMQNDKAAGSHNEFIKHLGLNLQNLL